MEKEIIIDKTGFRTIKSKPSYEELENNYTGLFHDNKSQNIRKNYQESYTDEEINHINLMNDLCLHSLLNSNSKWHKNKGTLFEVGVGEGFLLSSAKKKGWQIGGIDFNDEGIKKFNPELLKDVKIENIFDFLKNYNAQDKFDVCVIQNVLEHVIDPRKLLLDLKKILTKEGIIMIRVPNDFSDIQLKAKKFNFIKEDFWVSPPEHLNYFNLENIIKFVDSMDFEIVDLFSSFPIDFYLFHPGSNYIINEENGKDANQARVKLDLLMSQTGMENYYNLCKSWAKCGIGRNISIVIKPKK